MPDYKEMYLKLFNATEDAVNLLIAAQRQCEELYVEAAEPGIVTLPVQGAPEGRDGRKKENGE